MELTEPIESINKQLKDLFGIDTITGLPMFRIVWSEEQFENRLTEYSDGGIQLLHPEVRLLPKYRQWIQNKFVLERLVMVPDFNQGELAGEKLSFEPLWVFEDSKGNPLPPRVDAAKLVIDTVYAALGKSSLRKYINPEDENPIEVKKERIDKLQEELFGNETNIGDGLAYGSGVGYTGPINKG